MDADLQSLLKAWLNDEIDEADMHPLLDRLRSDAEFRKAFVDEIVMLGRLKAVQSAEPRGCNWRMNCKRPSPREQTMPTSRMESCDPFPPRRREREDISPLRGAWAE